MHSTVKSQICNKSGIPWQPKPPVDLDLGMNWMSCSQNAHDLDLYAREMCDIEHRRMTESLNGFPQSQTSWLHQNISSAPKATGNVYRTLKTI